MLLNKEYKSNQLKIDQKKEDSNKRQQRQQEYKKDKKNRKHSKLRTKKKINKK